MPRGSFAWLISVDSSAGGKGMDPCSCFKFAPAVMWNAMICADRYLPTVGSPKSAAQNAPPSLKLYPPSPWTPRIESPAARRLGRSCTWPANDGRWNTIRSVGLVGSRDVTIQANLPEACHTSRGRGEIIRRPPFAVSLGFHVCFDGMRFSFSSPLPASCQLALFANNLF